MTVEAPARAADVLTSWRCTRAIICLAISYLKDAIHRANIPTFSRGTYYTMPLYCVGNMAKHTARATEQAAPPGKEEEEEKKGGGGGGGDLGDRRDTQAAEAEVSGSDRFVSGLG